MTPYYEQDGITIYCGDCREVLPSLESDIIITDPPFFSPSVHYSSRRDWQKSWGDALVLGQWFDVIVDACGANSLCAFCDPESYAVFYPAMYRSFSRVSGLVWDKGRIGMGTPWRRTFELILHGWNQDKEIPGGQSDVLRHSSIHIDMRLHPVDKPVPLLVDLVNCTSIASDTIVDPFMGGGSTLVAAKQEGRRAIGIEIEERYCEVAANRLAQGVLFGADS